MVTLSAIGIAPWSSKKANPLGVKYPLVSFAICYVDGYTDFVIYDLIYNIELDRRPVSEYVNRYAIVTPGYYNYDIPTSLSGCFYPGGYSLMLIYTTPLYQNPISEDIPPSCKEGGPGFTSCLDDYYLTVMTNALASQDRQFLHPLSAIHFPKYLLEDMIYATKYKATSHINFRPSGFDPFYVNHYLKGGIHYIGDIFSYIDIDVLESDFNGHTVVLDLEYKNFHVDCPIDQPKWGPLICYNFSDFIECVRDFNYMIKLGYTLPGYFIETFRFNECRPVKSYRRDVYTVEIDYPFSAYMPVSIVTVVYSEDAILVSNPYFGITHMKPISIKRTLTQDVSVHIDVIIYIAYSHGPSFYVSVPMKSFIRRTYDSFSEVDVLDDDIYYSFEVKDITSLYYSYGVCSKYIYYPIIKTYNGYMGKTYGLGGNTHAW